MANRCSMAEIQAILALKARDWSDRKIAAELGIDRGTVAKYVRLALEQAKPAKAPAGNEAAEGFDLCGRLGQKLDELAQQIAPRKDGSRPSQCEPYRQIIEEKLAQGLSAQRIYQDLAEAGESVSVYSVQRFVRRLLAKTPEAFRRMECEAGEEAQVDFGTGAPIETSEGKRRRPHVFRIVLSHSRKAYSEAVYRQTTENFIRCLENAFWHFGGVPKTLVIDNLKAAVTKADWYDPETNPKIQSFCAHYGTVILPTKPRTPRHKGKIENGVGYVKKNALKGRIFSSLEEENEHLLHWETRVADRRIHGTTKRQVGKHFEESERAALLPLPTDRFEFFHEAKRMVHLDGHIEVAKAYYSVPPEYVSRPVWVRWDDRMVRVFNSKMEQIALHARHEPGRFRTDQQHISDRKRCLVEEGTERLLIRAALIGAKTEQWSVAMLQARGIAGVRVLVGLLALARQYPASAIENACETAASFEAYRLKSIRRLIGKQSAKQTEIEFLDEHPIIRPMSEYGTLIREVFDKELFS